MTPDLLCHDWLQTGSYILCDGKRPGFPIQYTSCAFVELFGWSAVDCLQTKCGSLIGIESIKANDQGLVSVIEASRLSPNEAHLALDFLHNRSVHEVKRMVAENTGSFITLNRALSGRLIPTAVVIHALKYPLTEQSFAIGLQFDLSNTLTVAKLLDVVLHGDYDALEQSHNRLEFCLQMLTRDDVKRFLQRKAEDTLTGPGCLRKLDSRYVQVKSNTCTSQVAPSKSSLMDRRSVRLLSFKSVSEIAKKQNVMDVLASQGYVYGSIIGRGQCGTDSKVIEVANDGQSFAVKCFEDIENSSECSIQLQREYEILRRLEHPNIVKAKCVAFGDNCCGLVLELCVGRPLSQCMHRLADWQGHDILGKILSAVEHLHTAHKIAHRDLKADNIVVNFRLLAHSQNIDEVQSIDPARHTEDIIVKLVDFGSAKYDPHNDHDNLEAPMDDMEGFLRKTLTGSKKGSAYAPSEGCASKASSFHENRDMRILPPSRCGGRGNCSECDVFALGLVAIGLLLKEEIFTRRVFSQGVLTLPAKVSQVSRTVKDYVQALLNPDSRSRPNVQDASRNLPDAECWTLSMNPAEPVEGVSKCSMQVFLQASGLGLNLEECESWVTHEPSATSQGSDPSKKSGKSLVSRRSASLQ